MTWSVSAGVRPSSFARSPYIMRTPMDCWPRIIFRISGSLNIFAMPFMKPPLSFSPGLALASARSGVLPFSSTGSAALSALRLRSCSASLLKMAIMALSLAISSASRAACASRRAWSSANAARSRAAVCDWVKVATPRPAETSARRMAIGLFMARKG